MSRRLLLSAASVAIMALPIVANAQAYSCTAPAILPRVHPELPNERNPQRLLPIGGYTLAVTWTPEYCHGRRGDPAAAFECEGANFGFALHGLWPDGIGPEWPQYCKSTTLLPPVTIRHAICATPSAQLLQHEWAKHGTCTGLTPEAYFTRSTGMFAKLMWPDMGSLARSQTSAGALAQAVARANPGLTPDMVRVTANRNGWLDELWICLDRQMAYTRCRAGSGGVPASTTIKIAPPR